MASDLFKMCLCYLVGAVVVALPAFAFMGLIGIYVLGVGLAFGLPALIVLMLIYAFNRERVIARPNRWCLAAPFIATVLFFITLHASELGKNDIGFAGGAGSAILAAAFIGSGIAVLLFRLWVLFPITIRRKMQPPQDS